MSNPRHPDTPGPLALGHYVRRTRQSRGLGLREAARAAQVDATWLSRVEQGQYVSPDARLLMKVARALEVDAEDLYAAAGLTTGSGCPASYPTCGPNTTCPTTPWPNSKRISSS